MVSESNLQRIYSCLLVLSRLLGSHVYVIKRRQLLLLSLCEFSARLLKNHPARLNVTIFDTHDDKTRGKSRYDHYCAIY